MQDICELSETEDVLEATLHWSSIREAGRWVLTAHGPHVDYGGRSLPPSS